MQNRRQLHLIATATTLLTDEGLARVRSALDAGVDVVQVREPGASAREILAAANRIAPHAAESGTSLTINDRADVAAVLGNAGVHLGARSLPADVVRRSFVFPLIGVSVHSIEEAVAATAADYVTFGHVFATGSHPGEPPAGIGALADVVAAVELPVIAIGGINASSVADVIATGCAGIAVISAILDAADPGAATRALHAALDQPSIP
ncbi:MAG: thiamine phosphate synthase [Thermomicrobiales bacterium]